MIEAIREIENGLVDAVLGGHLFKKRVSKPGMGKSGAYRTLIATKQSIGWIFIFGYEKNELDNIDKVTLSAFKTYVNDLFLNFDKFIESNIIVEIII